MPARRTSAEAFAQIRDEGLLNRSRFEVYEVAFHAYPSNRTAAEIATTLGVERRDVSSRCTELVKRGVFQEDGERPCTVSGRRVIAFVVTADLPRAPDRPKALSWGDVAEELEGFGLLFGQAGEALRRLEEAGAKPRPTVKVLRALATAGLTLRPKAAAGEQGELFG